MKNKIKQFFMNPWTVAVGSGLIVMLVTIIIDFLKAEKIFSTIKEVLIAVWTALLIIFNFEVKVWWLLVGILVLACALWIWVKYLDSKQSANSEPQFLEYTQDMILGYKWKWTWAKNSWGKYDIEQLHPICSRCDTPLVYNEIGYGGTYTCLRCNNGTNRPMPNYENVKMLIRDNVRRKYFPND